MKFVDEAEVFVRAGSGGKGAVSFRRERCIPRGGPDGGNGGNGGHVFFVADQNLNTLADFRGNNRFIAKDGQSGRGKNCHGACAKSIRIPVPLGTQVYVSGTDHLMGEIINQADELLVAKGGQGGLGNDHFKTSVHQAPRKATLGQAGQALKVHLELKVLADAGLAGLPNAGKSSLTQAVSGSTTQIADYPFTTLHPHLAVIESDIDKRWVLADIPGLIEGASEGLGLGIRFLKHLSRVKVLLYVLDASLGHQAAQSSFETLYREISAYSDMLVKRPYFIILNKCDLLSLKERTALKNWAAGYFSQPSFLVSAKTKAGLDALIVNMQDFLDQLANDDQ